MVPFSKNYVLVVGATNYKKFRARNKSTGQPIDLTGQTPKMQIRDKADGVVLFELSIDNGRLFIEEAGEDDPDPTLGYFGWIIEADDPEFLNSTFTTGVYDLVFEATDGNVDRYLKGNITIDRTITRV